MSEQSPLGPPAQVKRLGHKAALLELMRDGGWHHMDVLREAGGWRYGARLFELKRDAGWDYEKRRIGVDVFEYRLFRASAAATPPKPPPPNAVLLAGKSFRLRPDDVGTTEGASTIIAASLPIPPTLPPRTRPRLSQCWRGTEIINERAGWWIGFGFDVATISYLKRSVPMEDRIWVKEKRLWWVAEAHSDVLRQAFSNFEAFEGQTPLF